jgi:hypothetical protein
MKSTIDPTLLQKSKLVRVIAPTDSKWQECLDAMPYDFYHLPGYLELEARKHNAQPEAILIQEGEQLFFLPYLIRDCGLLFNTSNFGAEKIYDVISPYGYPGMLISLAGRNREFITKCLNLVYEYWQQQHICAAFLRLHPILNDYIDPSFSTDRFTICHQGDVVVCDLSIEIDRFRKDMRRTHRTRITKLKATGFSVSMVDIDRYLDTFVDIYRETMNRVNASQSYYYTREYFRNLVRILADRLHLCAVEVDGRIVSACLVTEFNGTVQYHLGGTLTEYGSQAPTTLTINYITEWAQSRNNQYLNLGGGVGGSQDSLYHFKAGFSDLSQPYLTIKSIVNRDFYDRLTQLKATSSGIPITEINNTAFFPSYSLN